MANENLKKDALNKESEQPKEAFFDKYKKQILYALGAVIILIVACILYNNLIAQPREDKASTTLAKAQELFDTGDFEAALNGDKAGNPGFVKIASEYGSTDAGNLANFYAGLCLAQKGKGQEAISYLEKFDAPKDAMVGPASKAALGNAYAHLQGNDNLAKAASLLKDAAKLADNNSLSPTFLVQAGEILEKLGKPEEALKCYQEVKDKYFNSMAAQTIDKYIDKVKK